MRILVAHSRYRSAAPSGENRVVDQESAALAAAGHTVERFERHSDDIGTWSRASKMMLPARVVWNGAARRDIRDAIRRYAPDVVHLHNTFPLLSPSVLYGCRDARVPVVATVHNYKLLCASGDFLRHGTVCHDCASGSPMSAVVHRCYRGSAAATLPVAAGTLAHRRSWRELVSAYVFLSAEQRRLMAGLRLDPGRTFVKPNFVPDGGASSARRRRQVAYVGRLDDAKGVPLLLDAWDRYRAAAGDGRLRLVIVGGGPLEDRVTRWALTRPSVEFRGQLDKEGCFEVVSASRAVVLPSAWEETFGLVLVEAMAAGVPAVAAAHGSFPELLSAGHDGALFPAGDAAALATMLREVDTDPRRWSGYGSRARITYERRFRVERNLEMLLDIYRFAIAQPVWATGGRR